MVRTFELAVFLDAGFPEDPCLLDQPSVPDSVEESTSLVRFPHSQDRSYE